MNRKQPKWLKPEKSVNEPVLKIYNSLTKQKEVFQPSNQRQVTWYTCGPTVYAPSHIGHARAYLTSDIIRKILEDYFNYNVLFVMNVTDIDDKIIIAARQKLLFEEFKNSKCALDLSLIQEIESAFDSFVESKFIKFYDKVQTNWETFVNEFSPGSSKAPTPESEPKYKMFFNSALKGKMAIDKAKINIKNGNTTIEYAHTLCDDNQDQLSVFLDKLKGHTVTDQKPFRDFARFYEEDYFDDMNRLGIRKPDIITRVTEYVPEIAEFVAKIIENKFAYEVDGSVYFDTANFDSHPDHFYAKLEPWSAGDLKLLAEGEGDLTTTDGKRNKSDFALWKKSKLGEPAWPSPWGLGRPGWHIECSVMASHVLGSNFDIHSGGIDLAFPHHDNEIAQSEAAHNCGQWVNYFIHTGHLHVEGQKMSKSLKNFISIKEAVKIYNIVHIRILFLLHSWGSTLHFDEAHLKEAREFEGKLNNFFAYVNAEILKASQPHIIEFTGDHDFGPAERGLLDYIQLKQAGVHAALCDSFNTPLAMSELKELVSVSNQYLTEKVKLKGIVNVSLITKAASYVMKMMKIFGVVKTDVQFGLSLNENTKTASNANESATPFIKILADFRDDVRELSQKKADHKHYLALSDKVRDIDLVDLGVVLDDRGDGKALIKFVDRETLLRQKEEKAKTELLKQQEKEKRLMEQNKKKMERLEKGKVPPELLFKDAEGLKLYSAWDEKGIPASDKEGLDLAKSKKKKLIREYEAQTKLHKEYLEFVENENK